MSISPLNVQQIVAVIRQQMVTSVRTQSSEPGAQAAGLVNKREEKRTVSGKADQSALGKMISNRVSALKKTDPDRGRKAFRIFLESVLINEFGENLINDPGFYQLVEDIHHQMESASEIEVAMQEATAILLADAADAQPNNDKK